MLETVQARDLLRVQQLMRERKWPLPDAAVSRGLDPLNTGRERLACVCNRQFAVCLTADRDAPIRRATEGDGTGRTTFTVRWRHRFVPVACRPIADCACSMTWRQPTAASPTWRLSAVGYVYRQSRRRRFALFRDAISRAVGVADLIGVRAVPAHALERQRLHPLRHRRQFGRLTPVRCTRCVLTHQT